MNQKKIYSICLKFCLKIFVVLHIPEVFRHTVMPTWVNQTKIYNCFKFCFKMLILLHIPEVRRHKQKKIYNICLEFCLQMSIMLHIPEALRQTVMPGLLGEPGKDIQHLPRIIKMFIICCISQKCSGIR